jgi:hypothetical protein
MGVQQPPGYQQPPAAQPPARYQQPQIGQLPQQYQQPQVAQPPQQYQQPPAAQPPQQYQPMDIQEPPLVNDPADAAQQSAAWQYPPVQEAPGTPASPPWPDNSQASPAPEANQPTYRRDEDEYSLVQDPRAKAEPEPVPLGGYGAPGPVSLGNAPKGAQPAAAGAFAQHSRIMGLVIMIVCGLAIVGGVAYLFVGTTRSPLDTVQHFWYWANRIDVAHIMECWNPDYVKKHPEVQADLLNKFDNPDSPYMGGRLRTNSYDELTYEVKNVGGQLVATTYAPGELTGKTAGTKDKLTEIVKPTKLCTFPSPRRRSFQDYTL